jgi:archaemetzincin
VNAVALVAIGSPDEEAMQVAARVISESLGLDVLPMQTARTPAHAHNLQRGQYDSFVLLRDLLTVRPPCAFRVLGVTDCDLYVPMLSFVFGQAQLGGPAALVSHARLAPEFYGLPPRRDLLLERTAKTVLHEMGHTLGLIHCPDPQCAMALATGVAQLDRKLPQFCAACWPRAQGVTL